MIEMNKNNTKIIPHSRPTLGQEEVQRVAKVIESAQIAQGEKVRQFEQAFGTMLGTAGGVATSSGTAALHLTLLAMNIGEGDEVIFPSYVCSALLNAVYYVGATPVLTDIDPLTFNIDPADVKKRLTARTRAIIVPHLFGLPADLDALLELNIPIIEDCAQAVGSTYRGKPVGAFGYAAVFSFYATKVMTTGEGGMVVSNSTEFIERVQDLREYDKRDQYNIRYNYKMTDIQAELGLSQFNRLTDFIQRRKDIANRYSRAFENAGFKLPPHDPSHIYYRYVIDLTARATPWIKALAEKKITCARPVHMPLHRYLELKGYPQTDRAWEQSISLPIYPSLSEDQIDRVIDAFLKTAEEFRRE
jgi:dTDP-4-amino-4,6-dideoxygalactose transaminase